MRKILCLLGLILLSVLLCIHAAAKNKNSKYIVPNKSIVMPEEYGASGDGISDDTNAFREALYISCKKGKVLLISPQKNYKITGAINYFNGKYQSYNINILGVIPIKQGAYTPNEYGGISLEYGTSLFKDATIKGCIKSVCICGKRNESVRLFDNCECSNFVMFGCNISNFGAIFYDTSLKSLSEISFCNFLSALYFSRNVYSSSGCTDSSISNNYINGGEELNDNSCFEWSYFNGVNLSLNFIDYYRTVYHPVATSSQAFVGPCSSKNQYQVFRYLYYPGHGINTISFYSNSDSFNWTNPASLKKISLFDAEEYIGKDNNKYYVPPFIAMCHSAWRINISGAKLESHVSDVIYVDSSLTEYQNNEFNVSFITDGTIVSSINYKQGADKPFYNNGMFPQNCMSIKGLSEELDILPEANYGWSSSPTGRRIKVDKKFFVLKNVQKDGKWVATWVEE